MGRRGYAPPRGPEASWLASHYPVIINTTIWIVGSLLAFAFLYEWISFILDVLGFETAANWIDDAGGALRRSVLCYPCRRYIWKTEGQYDAMPPLELIPLEEAVHGPTSGAAAMPSPRSTAASSAEAGQPSRQRSSPPLQRTQSIQMQLPRLPPYFSGDTSAGSSDTASNLDDASLPDDWLTFDTKQGVVALGTLRQRRSCASIDSAGDGEKSDCCAAEAALTSNTPSGGSAANAPTPASQGAREANARESGRCSSSEGTSAADGPASTSQAPLSSGSGQSSGSSKKAGRKPKR